MKPKEKRSSKLFPGKMHFQWTPVASVWLETTSTIKSDGNLVLNQLKKANLPPYKEQMQEKN